MLSSQEITAHMSTQRPVRSATALMHGAVLTKNLCAEGTGTTLH